MSSQRSSQQKPNIFRKLLILIIVLSVFMLIYTLVAAYMKSRSSPYIDVASLELVQLDEPKEGDPIAIVDTTLGEVRFVLYPEYAPLAVKNFTELAESGFYDNTYVFHSESGAYCGLGCKSKNGSVKEELKLDRELVPRELHQNLWPFKGAVVSLTTSMDTTFFERMFGGGKYYCGSRFAFINTLELSDEEKDSLRESSGSEELADAFIEKGGIPNFSQQMTVFGQIYQGLDVAERLSDLETLVGTSDIFKVPKDDIMINSVTIGQYSKEETAESAAN